MSIGAVLPFVVIIALFWFLFIRPQMRRQRAARDLQSALAVGDKVMLTSGIFGEVAGIEDDGVQVTIAEGTTIKIVRAAIGQVIRPEVVTAEVVDEHGVEPLDGAGPDSAIEEK